MDTRLVHVVDLLVERDVFSKSRLEKAVELAEEQGKTLYQVLTEQDFISEDEFLEILSDELNLPFEPVDKATVDLRVANLIPEQFARTYTVIPLFQVGDALSVAMCNPFSASVIEELEILTGLEIQPVLTLRRNIETLYNYCYSYSDSLHVDESTSVTSLFEMGLQLLEEKGGDDVEVYDLAQEAPIAKLVDSILKQAITEKASDIHIEPEEDAVKIRYRIDGILKDVMSPPKKLESPIISRIKILSNLDITETRKPQDGRITIALKEKDIDFRVSTIKTIVGEKVVLRLLDKSSAFVSMEKIGLSEDNYRRLNRLISATSGIIVVCGPTGSGKTSSLYSCLSKINSPEKNIVTIEDPVEYNLDGINQIQVNPKIGVDFATGLTAIVRQDPDVIMVGEIRDLETASIATQAALTGHLVFSTLHTRNAAGTITRLIDMGVQPFLLNSSIIGVVGQRLVRVLCSNCKRSVPVTKYTSARQQELIKELQEREENLRLYEGTGCKFCDQTGFKGRTGIFEILSLDETIRSLVIDRASSEEISSSAQKNGMMPMREDGIQKVLAGITSIDEIARVLDL